MWTHRRKDGQEDGSYSNSPLIAVKTYKKDPGILDRPPRELVVESFCLFRGLHWPQLLTPTSVNGRSLSVRGEVTSGPARGRFTQGVSHASAHVRGVQSLTLHSNKMRNTATKPVAQKASLCSMLRGWGVGLGMRGQNWRERGAQRKSWEGPDTCTPARNPRHLQTERPCCLAGQNRPGQRCLEF